MPQPIWPTCIAFRHKLQPITQAEINACHLGYARSMRTMHLCIRSTVFFATIAYPFLHLIHRTLIFFLSFFFNRSHTTILILNPFTHRFRKHSFEEFLIFADIFIILLLPGKVYRYLLPSRKTNFLLSARFHLEST